MKKKLLACLLILSMFALPASAETIKHERVFAVLSSDGTAHTVIDSVRLENVDKLDEINDQSTLSSIKNVKDERTFAQDGIALVWDAKGKDIWYQGTSKNALPAFPCVTCTLDGKDISTSEIQGKSGLMTLTVAFKATDDLPRLMMCGMLLDDALYTDVQVENGFAVDDGSHTLVVGYGAVNCAEVEGVPTQMTLTANVQGFDLTDMTTAVSSQPLSMIASSLKDTASSASTAVNRVTACLNALEKGQNVFGNDVTAQLVKQVNTLLSGADALSSGANSLNAGLAALSNQNEALNAGADTLLNGLLSAANAQLAPYQLPALTKENYDQVLSAAIEKLTKASADATALTMLKAQLNGAQQLTDGIAAYTAGVAQAQAGAEKLAAGTLEISTGLSDAKQQALSTLRPLIADKLTPALNTYQTVSGKLEAGEHFDLVPEKTSGTLVYIIRTQLTDIQDK